MSDDPILDRFRPPHVGTSLFESEEEGPEETEAPSWERRGRVYSIKSRDVELFPVGALAEALNRKPTTIRSWESRGWYPKTPIRGPVQGHTGKRRLYTREMIEGTVEIAWDEGLMPDPHRSPPMEDTDFVARVFDLYDSLEI